VAKPTIITVITQLVHSISNHTNNNNNNNNNMEDTITNSHRVCITSNNRNDIHNRATRHKEATTADNEEVDGKRA